MTPLGVYLDALYGAEPAGSYVELRWRLRNGRGMGREFVAVRDPRLAALIVAKGGATDLYAGVAPRTRQEGGREAVERVHVLWADCDDAGALERLGDFNPAPAIVVRSGSGRHAYWPLWPPVNPDEAERANRRLAHALGADARATDAARILRPPGTFNHKTDPPRPVQVEGLEIEIRDVAQVVGDLPDPPLARLPARPRSERPSGGGDVLDTIAPTVYAEALTGEPVGRDGKIACPFHEDRTPSLHLYPDPEHGWTCYGCGRGGTIIDFGAALWGIEPRGAGFHELRHRLARELLRSAA